MPAVDSPCCAATAAPAYHRGWIRSTGPTTTGIAAPTPAFLGCCHRFLSPSRRIQRNFQNAARIPLRTATACRTSGPRVSAAGRILALPFSGSLERGLLPFRAEDRYLFRGQLALGFVFPSSPGRIHQGSFSLHLCHLSDLFRFAPPAFMPTGIVRSGSWVSRCGHGAARLRCPIRSKRASSG
jgi:hypothetical protein